MPKVSIITPTYNSNKFIERTIMSVLSQTFTDWEYLIIDDESTDNTVELINNFIKDDPRIKILKTEKNSGGPALPKNIGIENAKGEYVAFLDHDDEWLPEKLEKQLEIFKKSNNSKLGIVTCFVDIKNNNTDAIISKYNLFFKGNVIKKIVKECFILSSSCILTKLSILKEVGDFDTSLKTADDWDMWIRVSKSGYEFDFAELYLLNYFVHENNISFGNNDARNKKDFYNVCNKHKELFIKYSYFNIALSYFIIKDFKVARIWFFKTLFFKNSSVREIIKSFGYICLTFTPNYEEKLRKIWRIFKK